MTPALLDQVPWNMPMPPTVQQGLLVLNSVIALLALAFLVSQIRQRKDGVPLYVLIGAGLAIFYEPLGDMLVSAFYPAQGQIGWISGFGRRIPMFIGILYFWYMSVPAIYFLKIAEQGASATKLWSLYFAVVIFATLYEIFGVSAHAWVYYGPQPFVVLGVPLWAPFSYAGFTVVICMGVKLIVDQLGRERQWLLIPAIPALLAGGHCALALPGAAAMFSTDDPLWIWAGCALSMGLSLLMAWIVVSVYAVRPQETTLPLASRYERKIRHA